MERGREDSLGRGTEGAIREHGSSFSRRDTLKLSGALGVALLGGVGTGVASAQSSGWTLVAVPDTQKYVRDSSLVSYAQDQTDWIAANLDDENIVFVTHEGDWVDNGSSRTQWRRMNRVWNAIEGKVPYAAAIGDHDYAVEEDRSSSTANYRRYFGKRRYQQYRWFGGSAPNDLSHYQRFSAGGYDFLHIDLEWEAPDSAIAWAQEVLDANPDTPTIVTTHSYLWDKPGREGRTNFVEENDGDGNSGQQIFRKLVRLNPQVFMTLNGNFHKARGTDDGEWKQVSENAAGLDVYEMLACYQDYPRGGDGWLRLIQFLPGGGSSGRDRIRVRTYSPSRDEFQTDDRSQFTFDLRFADRFGASSGGDGGESGPEPEPGSETVTFQAGNGGYDGTIDTYLQEAAPSENNGSTGVLNVDRSDPRGSGHPVQALVRFDDIVGSASGQIPSGASVSSATLTVETTGRGDGAALHRMRRNWSESDTWDSLGDGVQADGSEAASSADVETGSVSTGPTAIDVTTSVRAWVDGSANYGWAFLPSGRDGWDFYSAEGATPPTLTVTFER